MWIIIYYYYIKIELQDIINLFEELDQDEIVSKLKKVSKDEQTEFVDQEKWIG